MLLHIRLSSNSIVLYPMPTRRFLLQLVRIVLRLLSASFCYMSFAASFQSFHAHRLIDDIPLIALDPIQCFESSAAGKVLSRSFLYLCCSFFIIAKRNAAPFHDAYITKSSRTPGIEAWFLVLDTFAEQRVYLVIVIIAYPHGESKSFLLHNFTIIHIIIY